ncbi:MAG: rhomboid family intramembrane serine protease [Saprospiraceae bacterium]|nr:rhomboid family intramembrane serine protease [Saprospiraceae bacterium]
MEQSVEASIQKIKFPLFLLLLIWIVEIYEYVRNVDFSDWGIFPREWDGFIGILTAPYIHSDFEHLMSNSVPLVVLTTIMMFFYSRVAIPSYFIIQFLTGFSVWLFARPSYHIGASGVVYGLVAFVFWSGIFRRNLRSIVLALIVVVLYSGYFHGIVPNKEGVSWESHLFGGLVGIFTAFLFKDITESADEVVDPWADEEEPSQYFLPRDTFEKTKWQKEQERLLSERRWDSDSTLS